MMIVLISVFTSPNDSEFEIRKNCYGLDNEEIML